MAVHPQRPEDSVGYTPAEGVGAFIEACLAEAEAKGIDPSALDFGAHTWAVPVELSAAERIAEHTGRNEWVKVERFNDYLIGKGGLGLTSGEQAYLAAIISD